VADPAVAMGAVVAADAIAGSPRYLIYGQPLRAASSPGGAAPVHKVGELTN
jgi:hypothetical protein